MNRRDFVRVCSAGAGFSLVTEALAATPSVVRTYGRARLYDASGAPLRAASLTIQRNYVFFYPFQATPCFLLNLGKAVPPAQIKTSGQEYAWPGGVGAKRSLVAYSAICSHQFTYPTKDISFISFRAGKSGANRHADVIHCCSEHSQYDPANGARVLAGPAPRPLAAIMLEHDAKTDALYATGTIGSEVFDDFFRKYAFKLAMELGGNARKEIGDNCRVTELDSYCRQQVRC